MDKRGFIKTLEAVIAVLIMFIFIVTVNQQSSGDEAIVEGMKGLQEGVLEGISKNDDFRSCITQTIDDNLKNIGAKVNDPCPDIKAYVKDSLPERFVKTGNERYVIGVCVVGNCDFPEEVEGKKYVYTSAVIVSSRLNIEEEGLPPYNPRIVRIWMW